MGGDPEAKSPVRRAELQYDLPPELIAQRAIEPRDAARLLVLDRATGALHHRIFRDLGDYLAPGDCLVLNDTRVIPARFFLRRRTGGRVEALFLRATPDGWLVLLRGGARLRPGERLECERHPTQLVLRARRERGEALLQPDPPIAPLDLLARVGQTPLPPYIHRGADGHGPPEPGDAERYQTVYAAQPGAVAAPTAGLHFTAALLESLAARGVSRVHVTLHVGPGTFTPIETDDLADHAMHAEWFSVTQAAAETLRATRARHGRLVAVGTTVTRVLESVAGAAPDLPPDDALRATEGWTRLFIYPPYRFRLVDALITNFHLPGSTLLALVMAFASPDLIRRAYAAAIAERYRFYSYGDAMLIL